MTVPMPEPTPFQPDAVHAVEAQQEEINDLRTLLTTRADRIIYLRACMIQMQHEARTEIGRLHGEISMLRGELAQVQQPEEAPSDDISVEPPSTEG